MKKIVVSNLISLDGYYAGPQGEIDWFNVGKDFEAYAVELIGAVDTMLFGRVTYELMAGYWPTATAATDDPRIIDAMNNTPKIVFSNSLKNVGWNNTRVIRGELGAEISRLKQQSGRDIVVYGSGSLVSALTRLGLVDDFRIFVSPILLGKGKLLFEGIDARTNLRLVGTQTFESGLVVLRYQKA
jgi:dihydrofolate reductase